MSDENYLFVCLDENAKEEGVELPVEDDGTLLLSVLQSQFEGATGIKYRNEVTGGWRAVRLCDDMLHPPTKGLSGIVFVVVLASPKSDTTPLNNEGDVESSVVGVLPSEDGLSAGRCPSDGYKRKLEDQEGPRASKNPRSQSPDNYPLQQEAPVAESAFQNRNQEDLIVLGLEWTVTDAELRTYFEQFGQVTHCEVKKDVNTKKSRGFGFVRYGDRAIQAGVFDSPSHTIKGRRLELKYPKQSTSYMPNKLFVGCLPKPPEVDSNELTEYFSQFGRLTDVYIPRPYRGFGFVTFTDSVVAQKVVNMQHVLRKSTLNVSYADPKGSSPRMTPYNQPHASYGSQINYIHPRPPTGQQPMPPPRYPYSGQQPATPYGVAGYDGYSRAGQQDAQTPPTMDMVRVPGVAAGMSPSPVGYGGVQQTQQQDQTQQQQPAAYGQTWQIR